MKNNIPYIKLLDMLAGYSNFYADTNVRYYDLDPIFDLYQEAGNLEEPTPEEIKSFIEEKVIPFILEDK